MEINVIKLVLLAHYSIAIIQDKCYKLKWVLFFTEISFDKLKSIILYLNYQHNDK